MGLAASERTANAAEPRPRLVEEDHDEAETEYYEAVADPTFVTIEHDQQQTTVRCSVATCATAKQTAAPATSSAELPICGQSVPMPPM